MLDLNKMTLEEVLEYCENNEKRYSVWLMNLFVGNEGFEKAVSILAENGKI